MSILLGFAIAYISPLLTQTGYYGMTEKGRDGFGVIYKTNMDGNNYEVIHSFEGVNSKQKT